MSTPEVTLSPTVQKFSDLIHTGFEIAQLDIQDYCAVTMKHPELGTGLFLSQLSTRNHGTDETFESSVGVFDKSLRWLKDFSDENGEENLGPYMPISEKTNSVEQIAIMVFAAIMSETPLIQPKCSHCSADEEAIRQEWEVEK